MIAEIDVYDKQHEAYIPKDLIKRIEVTINYKNETVVRPAIIRNGELILV